MKNNYKVYLILSAIVVSLISGYIVFKNKPKEIVTPVVQSAEDTIPVVVKKSIIERPYKDESVSILSNFYDYKGTEENQVNSIIIYENTYMQNTGIIYGSDKAFDVLSVAPGEVINVSDSELTGKVVEVRHTNDIISIYRFLSDVNVKLNDKLNTGDKIGTSGLSNITGDNKNELHFEFIIRGELVNGEIYFGKNIEEL